MVEARVDYILGREPGRATRLGSARDADAKEYAYSLAGCAPCVSLLYGERLRLSEFSRFSELTVHNTESQKIIGERTS